jgi:hypothetical protein
VLLGLGDARAQQKSLGTDFFVAFPSNALWPENGVYSLALYITSPTGANVAIQTRSPVATTFYVVPRGGVVRIPFSDAWLLIRNADSVLPQAIHIVADSDVAVYVMDQEHYTADGYCALPVPMCGLNYVVASTPNEIEPSPYDTVYHSEFAIIGISDSTSVVIRPSAALYPTGSNAPKVVMLNRGEVYEAWSFGVQGNGGDLSGSLVTANKPVALLSGHERAYVPHRTDNFSRDMLVEQLLPTNEWGTTFIAVPPARISSPVLVRVFSAAESTSVGWNDSTFALAPYRYAEMRLTSAVLIAASHPVQVMEYFPTADIAGSGPDSLGDPALLTIPPLRGYDSTYTVVSPYFLDFGGRPVIGPAYAEHYLTIVTPRSNLGRLTLDGGTVDPQSFQSTPHCDYVYASLPVDSGTHRLSAPLPFALTMYGIGTFISYAYLGAIRTAPPDSVIPSSLVFRKQRVGTSFDSVTFVWNAGKAAQSFSSARVSGTNANDFQVLSPPLPMLQSGDTMWFSVRFRPLAEGTRRAILEICGDGTVARIPLGGVGIQPHIKIIPDTIVWAAWSVGSSHDSVARIVSFGTDTATLRSETIAGGNAGDFSAPQNLVAIPPGDTVPVVITFTPIAPGTRSSTFTVRSDAPEIPKTALIGFGTQLMLLTDTVDFRRHYVGTRADSFGFVLNTGSRSTVVDSVRLIGADSAEFPLIGPAAAYAGHALAPQDTLKIGVTFAPLSTGNKLATIKVYTQVAPVGIVLKGIGYDTTALALDSRSLGDRCLAGASAIQVPMTIHNDGPVTVTLRSIALTPIAGAWTITSQPPEPSPIAALDSAMVDLQLSPVARGPASARLDVVVRSAGGIDTTLTAMVSVVGTIDSIAGPALVDLGTTFVASAATSGATVTNTGDVAFTINTISFERGAPFSATVFLPVTLLPTDKLSFSVSATSALPGTFDDTMVVAGSSLCGPDTLRVPCRVVVTAPTIAVDGASLDTVYYCLRAPSSFAIRNTGNGAVTIDSIQIVDPCGGFSVTVPSLPVSLAQGDRLTVPFSFLPEAPMSACDAVVRIVYGPAVPGDSVRTTTLHALAAPYHVDTRADSVFGVSANAPVKIPIRIAEPLSAYAITRVHLSIQYDARVLQLDGVVAEPGDALDGFLPIGPIIDAPRGRAEIDLGSSPPRTAGDLGVLCRLSGFTLVDPGRTTTISADVSFPERPGCIVYTARPGLLAVDSVCGLTRGFLFDGTTSLSQSAPNPAGDAGCDIPFSTRDAGFAELILTDARGSMRRELFSGSVGAGAHVLRVDTRGVPSGVYRYELRTRDGLLARQMMIVR